jgi:lysozyme family protein
MGITQRTLNAYCKKNGLTLYDVKDLKRPLAIDIYYQEYWNPAWEHLGFELATCMFDTSVNMGTARALKFLQECNGDYVKYLQLRLGKYKELIEATPRLKVFERGWMNRMTELRRFIEIERDQERKYGQAEKQTDGGAQV